jgi:LPS-assembly protein
LPRQRELDVLGRWNFSILDQQDAGGRGRRRVQCRLLGTAARRPATGDDDQTTTNSVYLQIELNGLARFGTNPLDLLRRSVPGYQQTNDPTVSPRFRDDPFQEY